MAGTRTVLAASIEAIRHRADSLKLAWLKPALAGTAAFVFVLAAGFAVYGPNLNDFFALDDYIWLHAASNPDAVDFFRRAFSFPVGTLVDVPTPFWRPLVDAYFFAAWRVYGLDPLPYHITNLVLHGCVAVLAAVLVRQLTSSTIAAGSAGLVFVLLPTFDFAVSWISSVTELLAALFYLLTLVSYAGYCRGGNRWVYSCALAAFVLALLSKESAVTIPVILVGVIVVLKPPQSPEALMRRITELTPFAAVALAYFIMLYVQEYRLGADEGFYRLGWHAFGNIWDYLKWMTLPLSDETASWIAGARPMTAAIFLAVGGVAVVARQPTLIFAFGWTLVALLPYAFFPTGVEYRYTYLASVPFVIFAVTLGHLVLSRATARHGAYPLMAITSAAVLLLGVFLGVEARNRQEWISGQARAYSEFFHQVPTVCGSLPPESFVYVMGAPTFDYFGVSTRMAMNLHYDQVYVDSVEEVPELAVFIEHKCLLRYIEGKYVRVPAGAAVE